MNRKGRTVRAGPWFHSVLTAKSLSVSILADYLSSVDGEPYYRMSQYRRLSSSKVNHSFWSIRRIFADVVVRAQAEGR